MPHLHQHLWLPQLLLGAGQPPSAAGAGLARIHATILCLQ